MAGLVALDYLIIVIFFILVIYFSFLLKKVAGSTHMFFLAGRSLPGWLAGLTFITGNVSEMEILGLTGGGYVYGLVMAQYDWVGAIPAIVFLALVLVPYYYKNKIYNLLEFTGLRYGDSTRLFHSVLMLSYMLLALGTGFYVFSLALNVMLGLPIWIGIIITAMILGMITASGGLSSMVLVQFLAFAITWFTLVPISLLALNEVGWWSGLHQGLSSEMLTVWRSASDPFMPWTATILGLGFALSFASWSTDQSIMQNVLAARSVPDARMAPLIGGLVKLAVPFITVIPGMAAAIILPNLAKPDTAIFELILHFYPAGLVGLGFLSIMGAFAAMNTGVIMGSSNIFMQNIYRRVIKKGASEEHYLRASRGTTILIMLLGILTAFIASQFAVVYLWIQEYNAAIIVPLLGILLLGLFWRRMTTWGAFVGMGGGVTFGVLAAILSGGEFLMWRAAMNIGFVLAISIVVSLFTKPKKEEELKGLLWGTLEKVSPKTAWWRGPTGLAILLLAIMTALLIVFA